MIQMILHLQSCHTPLNAPQFSNLFVFCPLHIFTNHCVTSTFILQRPLLQQIFNLHSLNKKILKQLRECLQSYRLTQPRQAPVLIHQQLQAMNMWNQLLAYSLKIFWTLFILCFPGFFPFLLRPVFLSCIFSISYSLLLPFSLHSLFHSIHMGFCFASCWLSFLFCILLPFHSQPLACNCFFFVI